MSSFRKYTSIFVLLLACYALLGFLLIPLLIRHFAERALQDHCSPQSSISQVRMNPFLLSLRVEGLSTADANGNWTAAWDSFEVDISAKTFLKFYPVLDLIALDGSAVSFERTLEEEEASQEKVAALPSAGWRELMGGLNEMEIPKLHVDRLQVSDGQVTFVDHTNPEQYQQKLNPINFALSNVTTISDASTNMQLSAKTPRGAMVEWHGSIDTHPLRSEGTFSLEALELQHFFPYYEQFTQFNLKRAVFGLSLAYVFDSSDLDNLLSVSDTHVALTELSCEAIGENPRLLSIDEILVQGGTFKFPQMELGIERIGISDGQTLVHRNADGRINLLSLFAVPSSGRVVEVQVEADDVAEASGFTYHIDLIEVLNYQVSWQEDFAEEVASLGLAIPMMRINGVSSDLGAPFNFFADYRIGESGQIVLEGAVVPATLKVDASVKIENFALNQGAVYAQEFGGLLLDSGVLDFDAQVSYDRGAGLSVKGHMGVSSFGAEYGEDLSAQWEALTLSGISMTTNPMLVHLDSVLLDAPVLRVRNPATAPAVSEVTTVESSPVAEEGKRPSKSLAISVSAISVQQGAVTFVDESISPTATIEVSELGASVNHLDLASSTPVDLELSAKVNNSSFNLAGQFQPNDFKAETVLQFQLQGLGLPAFSSYTGRSVGRRISKGALSIDSKWTVAESQLQASNKILVNQLKFGDKVESDVALSLPLDLAVTLLAGPSGQMDLSLPLSGDLSDPKASLGQIIRAAVVGLVTNVAAAPFKLLSGLVGSEEDLSLVEFEPGKSKLSNEMLDRLNKMAEALKQRPELQLNMIPLISSEDQVELRQGILRYQILDDSEMEDDAKFRQGLSQLYREKMEQAGTPAPQADVETEDVLEAMLAAILPEIDLPEGEIERMATERSEVIAEHFITSHGIESTRLNAAAAEPSDGAVGLRFDLQ